MADPTDPLGVLDVDPKKLELIRQFFKEYTGDANLLSKQLQAVGRELGLIVEKTTEAATAEAEIRDMYKSRAVLAKNINEILSSNKQIRDEELKKEKAALVQAEQAYIKTKERLALVKEEIAHKVDLLKENKKEYKTQKEILEDRYTAGRMQLKEFQEAIKQNRKKALIRRNYLNSLGKEKEKLEDLANVEYSRMATEAETFERSEKRKRGMDTSVASLDSMIEKTGLFSEKWKTGPLGGLTDFLDGGGDMSDMFDELKLKADKINFSNLSANVVTAIIEQTIKFMLEFDKLASSFRKNTGIIDRGFGGMESNIVGVQRATLRMGVSMDEAFAAANALTSGMAEFTSMSDKAQDKVLQVTALMQEFGVSAQTTSEIFNTFSKGLGYDADQLEKLGTQIMGIATSLKVPPQIIATEFNAASKELMKYGGDMINVFEGLAEQSKQTGLAIGELMGVVKQYDTFEGAGEAVGKLNAILGGPYLNSINMLYATEEDRVKMLRESISLTGRQFKDLSRFEQQAIASAAGISDMSQAAKLFGGTASEFANSRMEMKEMQEQAAKAQSAMDKFKMVMQSFAIALGPLVTALGLVATVALYMLNPFGEIARLFGADSEVISGIGTFTVVGYGLAGMIVKGWIPALAGLNIGIVRLKMSTFQLGAALMAAVAVGLAMYNWVESMSTPLAVLATLFMVAALAAATYWTAQSLGVGAVPIALGMATVGAAFGGIAGIIAGYEDGKNKGQQVPGGRGLVGENGEEMVMTADGAAYMVTEPSVVELGTQDTVLNNAETKAAMAGGGSKELVPVLTALQNTLNQLTAALDAAKNPIIAAKKDTKPLIIKMDGRKVAESTVEYIKKSSNLSLTPK